MAAYIEEKHKSGAKLHQLRKELLRLQKLIRLVAEERAELTSMQLAGDILRLHSGITADIEDILSFAEGDTVYFQQFVNKGESYEITKQQ